ncbi:hypothetical protein B0H21DRAFT_776748 [Amylocystis lapponica]|nr:hypothetical protein B0H21DRAFT_776748 [Amylocystis lapponica]
MANDSTLSQNPLLDDHFYHLDEQELTFFKALTGLDDDTMLREHITAVQAEAFKVHPYPCIRWFGFSKLKISRLPAYNQLLDLGKVRVDAIFLDIGCCFGNDARKAVADGFPAENTITSDIEPEFWQLGHKLFKSSAQSFPVPFIAGDVFDAAFLQSVQPFYASPGTARPILSSISTLTLLLGHVTAIHASSLFHLFEEPEQLQLAQSLAGLLSPEIGSFIFGAHNARPEKGYRTEATVTNTRGKLMFCHSPESWIKMWDGDIFTKGTVKVETSLHEIQRHDLLPREGARFWTMDWSVTRL